MKRPPALRESLASARATLRRWQDAATTAPRLALLAVRRGLLPVGVSTVATLHREGRSDLHWKVLGDALVRFFQGAGPLLTKLGQVLATRSDLLPPAVCARLETLYAGQPAMSRSQLKRRLLRAYGKQSPFADFDAKPIAVGSVGQVHRARLENGEPVIVKILRPGVHEAVQRDLNAARVFLQLFFRSFSRKNASAQHLAERALEDLARGFGSELDLENEADAFEEFRRRFKRNPRVYVPACYREWCSRDILVLEELSGEPLSALRARNQSDPAAARQAADLALREILTQIFDEGRFHADPHGGNLLLLKDGRLGLIDLGLTGALEAADRRNITRAVRAFLAGDWDASCRALLAFGTPPPDFVLEAFKSDIREVFHQSGVNLVAHVTGRAGGGGDGSRRLEDLVNALFQVAHRHRLYVPPSTTLLIKTLVTIEGVARSLDPNINVVVTAVPIILKSLTPRWLRWENWARAH